MDTEPPERRPRAFTRLEIGAFIILLMVLAMMGVLVFTRLPT
jgi:hypothetical protein